MGNRAGVNELANRKAVTTLERGLRIVAMQMASQRPIDEIATEASQSKWRKLKRVLVLVSILAGAFLFAPPAKAQFTTASAIDCSMFTGAPDMGVQLNNCLAAGPATGAI
jgi:hypothetical protein